MRPMSSGAAPVEQARRGQQKCPGAHGGDAACPLGWACTQSMITGSTAAASTPSPPATINVSTAAPPSGSKRVEQFESGRSRNLPAALGHNL